MAEKKKRKYILNHKLRKLSKLVDPTLEVSNQKARFAFWVVFTLFLTIFTIVSIKVLTKDDGLSFFGEAQIDAVTYDSTPIENEYDIDIIWYEDVNLEAIKPDMFLVLRNSRANGTQFVEKVIAVDHINLQVLTVFGDSGLTRWYSFDKIVGTYTHEANFLGLMLFEATQMSSYIFVMIFMTGILMLIYLIFVRKATLQEKRPFLFANHKIIKK